MLLTLLLLFYKVLWQLLLCEIEWKQQWKNEKSKSHPSWLLQGSNSTNINVSKPRKINNLSKIWKNRITAIYFRFMKRMHAWFWLTNTVQIQMQRMLPTLWELSLSRTTAMTSESSSSSCSTITRSVSSLFSCNLIVI